MQKVSNTAYLIAASLGAAALAPTLSFAGPAPVPTYQFEKCYGVNAAGKNDCAASGSHSCAGESKRAHDPQSFIYVPSGTCAKIAGGTVSAKG